MPKPWAYAMPLTPRAERLSTPAPVPDSVTCSSPIHASEVKPDELSTDRLVAVADAFAVNTVCADGLRSQSRVVAVSSSSNESGGVDGVPRNRSICSMPTGPERSTDSAATSTVYPVGNDFPVATSDHTTGMPSTSRK